VRDSAFPRHPRGERRDFVERHAGVVADAALRRSERDVVLDAVAGEHFDLAVVHLHRARHDDLALRMREDLPDARIEAEDARGAVELLEHRIEDAAG
jgi:hypothetical protein